MNLRLYYSLVIFVLFLLLLASCGEKEIDELKAEVNDMSSKINNTFLDMKKKALENTEFIKKTLSQDRSNVSIDGFMEEEGGLYAWHEGYIIYPKKEPVSGAGMVLFYNAFTEPGPKPNSKYLPGTPGALEIMKKMKVLNDILGTLKEMNSDETYKTSYYLFTTDVIQIHPIHYDYPSIAVPGLPGMFIFDFWNIVTPENDPEKAQKWTKDAYVDMAGQGWLMSISTPLYLNDKFEGITTKDIYLFDIKDKLIKQSKNIILFVSSGMSIIGSSEPAKEELEINEIDPYDILEQLKTNPAVTEEYNLDYKNNPEGLKNIAAQIKAGKTEFEQKIKKKTYSVFVSAIPEVNFYIVGLLVK